MRLLLHRGKGGVGTTTIAAATAVHCASLGQVTLLLSLGGGASPSTVFDATDGPVPARLTERPSAATPDPHH